MLGTVYGGRDVYGGERDADRSALELCRDTALGTVGSGCGRRDLDEPQVSGVWRTAGDDGRDQHCEYRGQCAERRRQRVELYTAVWSGRALLYAAEPVDRHWGECDPYLERVAGGQEPRGKRERAVYGLSLIHI